MEGTSRADWSVGTLASYQALSPACSGLHALHNNARPQQIVQIFTALVSVLALAIMLGVGRLACWHVSMLCTLLHKNQLLAMIKLQLLDSSTRRRKCGYAQAFIIGSLSSTTILRPRVHEMRLLPHAEQENVDR